MELTSRIFLSQLRIPGKTDAKSTDLKDIVGFEERDAHVWMAVVVIKVKQEEAIQVKVYGLPALTIPNLNQQKKCYGLKVPTMLWHTISSMHNMTVV